MTRFVISLLVTLVPLSAGAAKKPVAEVNIRKAAPENCVAVRGNGQAIFAHFTSLARILEHYGFVDGLAGGSSGSITGFIYESMIQNPALWDCPECSSQDLSLRGALLLKTISAYYDTVATSSDARAVFDLFGTVKEVQTSLQGKDLAEAAATLTPAQIEDIKAKFEAVLAIDGMKGIVNPDLLEMLRSPGSPALKKYQFGEIRDAIQNFGQWTATNKRIFFRPGLVSFVALATQFGKVGDFYAGRGGKKLYDHKGFKKFLDRCAPQSLDLTWEELKAKDPSCGKQATKLIEEFRAGRQKEGEPSDTRLNETVGKHAHILATFAVLEAPEAKKYQEGLKRYLENDGFEKFEFNVYDGLKYGHAGQDDDLKLIDADPRGYAKAGDLKTRKRTTVPGLTWRTVLSLSPAEPGLSNMRPIEGTDRYSAAGWSDLAPTLALRNLGCKRVIYVSRLGVESVFGRGVPRTLGATDADDRALTDLADPKSSLSRSISEADATWCTDWDHHPVPAQLAELKVDSYAAPLESAKDILAEGYPPYGNQIRPKHIGCGGKE